MLGIRVHAVILAMLFALLTACSQPAQTPSQRDLSTQASPSLGRTGEDYGTSVAISAKIGAIFVTSYGETASGEFEGFLWRYNQSGEVVWRRSLGFQQPADVTIDEAANVYVVGGTYKAAQYQALIRKFDKNGSTVWTRVFNLQGSGTYATSVHTDKRGSAYVAGGLTDASLSARSYVRKYQTDGAVTWTKLQNVGDFGTGTVLRTDWRGNVYVGGTALDEEFNRLGYIFKYSSSGRLVWSRYARRDSILYDLAVRGDTLYVVGDVQLFDEDDFVVDAFVSKYRTDGKALWTRQFGSANGDGALGVSVDSQGRAYVTGYTTGDLISGNLGNGVSDIFVRKYRSSGGVSWTRQFGSSREDYPSGIATFKDTSDVYLVGSTYGSLGAPNRGGADAFLRRIDGASGRAMWTRQ